MFGLKTSEEEIIGRINFTFRLRRILLAIFILTTLFLVFVLNLGVDRLLKLLLILVLWLLLTFIFEGLGEKGGPKKDRIEDLYFLYSFLEAILFTFLVYFTGGIAWILLFFGSTILIFAHICLDAKKAFLLAFILIILMGIFIFIEYVDVIPHQEFFDFDLSKNFQYVLTTFIGFVGFIIAVSFNLNVFSVSLDKKNRDILEAYKKINDVKNSLKIRVDARKVELEELTKKLDRDIKLKTRNLKERIAELEKVNRKMIKRELEMIKLKKEIKALKEELGYKT